LVCRHIGNMAALLRKIDVGTDKKTTVFIYRNNVMLQAQVHTLIKKQQNIYHLCDFVDQ
jgi:hypothetical protein